MSTDKKYHWDTTKFCTGQEQFDQVVKQIEQLSKQISGFKGKLGQKESLLQYLKLDDQIDDLLEPLFVWTGCATNVDVTDAVQNANQQKLEVLASQIGQTQAFVMPEILSQSDEFFDQIVADEQFLPWRHTFLNLKQQKQHVLSPEQQEVVSILSPVFSNFEKNFMACAYADTKFGKVLDSNGEEHELTNTNYAILLENPDRTLRKNAFERSFEVHSRYLNVLASNLNAQVQRNTIMSKLYHYPSVFDESVAGLNINRQFYDKFVENTQQFFALHKQFNQLRIKAIQKQYNIEDIKQYDTSLPIGKKLADVSFEQGVNTVKQALGVLGKDYVAQIDRAVNERWFDVFPSDNKLSGAYSCSAHGFSPVVLLNWENSLDDIYSLAHELGHAIRHVYCGEHGFREAPQTALFVDETFSTTNQVLVYRYLVENEQDKQTKIYLLSEYIFNLFHYLSSVLDGKCEDFLYSKVANNQPASKDEIIEYTKSVYQSIQSDLIAETQPPLRTLNMFHYYNQSYYVWQYTCGILNANFIANKILENPEEFVPKYLKFLSAGSMYPLDMLKIVDIDYDQSDVFDAMKTELLKRIEQLNSLLND